MICFGRSRCASTNRSTNKPFDLGAVPSDPVIARQLRSAQLQPVARRFAGQHRQCRVVAQLVVIDEVFITQRQRKNPLPDQRPDGVLDQLRRAAVSETLGKPIDQPDRLIRRPQQ